MFYRRCLRYSVVGFVISHVIDDLPGMAAAIGLLVLFGLLLGAILATSSGMDQLIVEVVVVVLVKVSVRHDEAFGISREI